MCLVCHVLNSKYYYSIKLVLFNYFIMGIIQSKYKNIEAVAVISSNSKIKGTVIFKQKYDYVKIYIDVSGLSNNHKHGFHIHEAGDLRVGCTSCCSHYNPTNTSHSGLDGGHAGDLGNIETNAYGTCIMTLKTDKFCVDDIVGRSIIIHEDEDDLGLGLYNDSQTTGHSGNRIACSVIGISKENT